WLVNIEPYIEAGNLYVKIDKEQGWEADENRFAALLRQSTYHCPGFPKQPPLSPYYSSHYLGMSGIGKDAVSLPEDDNNTGFFGYARQLPIAMVQARSQPLVTMTETCWATGAWTAAGPPTVRGLADDGTPYLGCDGQFGGNHRGGLNVAFADGSVRFLNESID